MSADRSDDFGSRLRAARERKGISLRDIASRTKISVAVLEALERNDVSRLPGGIFSRAFVRSYANEVGLDPELTIQDFIAQFPQDSVIAGHPPSDSVEDTELFESERRVASSVLWILGASVALAGAVLYLSVARGSAPAAEPASAAAGAQPVPNSPSSAGEPAPPTEPSPGVNAPTESAVPSSPPVAPASRSSQAPAARPGPVTAPSASGAAAPAGGGSAPTAASPGVNPPAAAGDRLFIELAARRPVWVSATVDGQKALSRLLQPGERQRIEVTREMVITAGDAAAIRMTVNGIEARALGNTGEVVTARVTLANFKDYLVSR